MYLIEKLPSYLLTKQFCKPETRLVRTNSYVIFEQNASLMIQQ